MRSLAHTRTTIAALTLLVAQASSQQIRGPVGGSLPAGERRLNRGVLFQAFRTSSIPMSAEPRRKGSREFEYPAADQLPASAPAGTNYVPDLSTTARPCGVPPLILESFQGASQGGYAPPDPVIAAGPRHLLVAVNEEIRILTREGALAESIDAGAWYDALIPGCRPFDPRVLYDHYTGRYMMLWLEYALRPASSHYLLSISESDDPTGQWVSWALPAKGEGPASEETWADNACLGFDSAAVYIVSNQYTFEKTEPVDVRIRIIAKRGLSSGSALEWNDFMLTGAFCVRPAVIYGHADCYYLLEARNPQPTAGAVVLYRLEDADGLPRLTSGLVPVVAYGRAMDPGQPGGGVPLDARKSYLHSEVVVRNELLHAAFSVANPVAPGCSALRYLCIDTEAGATREDITFGSPWHWYFHPALAVNRNGDVAITFSRSGPEEFPGCYFTWRVAIPGSPLAPATTIQAGWAHYQWLDGVGKNRWGDYSGAAVDPADGISFWLTGEYADGPDTWGTWVNAVRLEPLQVPRLIVDPRAVDLGLAEVGGRSDESRVTIRNGGAADLIITHLTVTPPFAVAGLPPLPASLGLYDSLVIPLHFLASSSGQVAGDLAIVSNDPAGSVRSVALRGTGIVHGRTIPGTIYAVQEGRSGGVLHFLDWGGAVTASEPLGSADLRALSVGSWNGCLYGAARDNHGARIVRIDGSSGRAYLSSSIAVHGIGAMCGVGPDTFYCGTDTGSVYRFIPSRAELSLVGSRTGVGFSAFVQSSNPRQLWASARRPATNDTLYLIDVVSGAIVPAGRTGFDVATESICRTSDGLLGLVGSALVKIDTLTGQGSFHAYVALDGLRAIAEGMSVTDVGGEAARGSPPGFALEQNYPNPFNPSTRIGYRLPARSHVTLAVFDALGQMVATLVDGLMEAGYHEVEFDASRLAGGVYLYRLQAGRFVQIRKCLLVK